MLPREHLEFALQCLRSAEATPKAEDRETLLEIARRWMQPAADAPSDIELELFRQLSGNPMGSAAASAPPPMGPDKPSNSGTGIYELQKILLEHYQRG